MYAYVETCTCISWTWQTYRLCKTSVCNWISIWIKLKHIDIQMQSSHWWTISDGNEEMNSGKILQIEFHTKHALFLRLIVSHAMPCKLFHKYSACEFVFSRHSIIALISKKNIEILWNTLNFAFDCRPITYMSCMLWSILTLFRSIPSSQNPI